MVRALTVMALAALLGGAACASLAPPRPRFVAVYEQREEFCRIQVLQDTRTRACFIAFRCGRQPTVVLQVEEEICVP